MSCHSEESVSRRTTKNLRSSCSNAEILPPDRIGTQDDIGPRARARSTAPLTPCGAWETTFCFERWGLNQVGGIPEENQNLLAQIPYPKTFRVSTSWDLPPERCGSYLAPPPSCWQSGIVLASSSECKRNIWHARRTECGIKAVRLSRW
jgi:hypothetical protein